MSRTDRVTGDRREQELFNQMCDGFKMAASACRQLGVIQQNSDFGPLAYMIEHLGENARRLSTSLAMKKIEREGGLQRFAEALGGGMVDA